MQNIAAENKHSEAAFVVPRAAKAQGVAGSLPHPQRPVDRRSRSRQL
jgi:hypothetical protein